ncbi:hypothetical protein SDC9_88741 [bioreactor metagenome]|uniref:Uncharacterized protein n=1 Tax=bioreactor metagenome TaxID=1076179 RepID=A0A644ZMB2_9ZZZZ
MHHHRGLHDPCEAEPFRHEGKTTSGGGHQGTGTRIGGPNRHVHGGKLVLHLLHHRSRFFGVLREKGEHSRGRGHGIGGDEVAPRRHGPEGNGIAAVDDRLPPFRVPRTAFQNAPFSGHGKPKFIPPGDGPDIAGHHLVLSGEPFPVKVLRTLRSQAEHPEEDAGRDGIGVDPAAGFLGHGRQGNVHEGSPEVFKLPLQFFPVAENDRVGGDPLKDVPAHLPAQGNENIDPVDQGIHRLGRYPELGGVVPPPDTGHVLPGSEDGKAFVRYDSRQHILHGLDAQPRGSAQDAADVPPLLQR